MRIDRAEIRDWAFERLKGVINVVIPTFTNDFAHVNEAATRHDVRRATELGFIGTLLVAETATTHDEYENVCRWAAEEAGEELILVHHASFDSLDENIEMVSRAEEAGCTLCLVSYPPTFFPRTLDDVYEYTRRLCESTNLGVILFPIPLWGFERLHPASIPVDLLERMIDEIPNIVAIKAEGGFPSLGGFAEAWYRLHERVLVTMPVEQHAIPLATLVPMQLIATSNTEYYGDTVPRMHDLVSKGDKDEAMRLFWQINPARIANRNVANTTQTGHVINRMAWKYQAWLNGFNGGPLRSPTNKIVPAEMAAFRRALVDSAIPITQDPDELFFVGRNPTAGGWP
jgi:4-hydroxy-tetrahydrodipicolinate synthase